MNLNASVKSRVTTPEQPIMKSAVPRPDHRICNRVFDRDRQHHRHRHLHESWFSIDRYSVGVRAADAVGRGWHCGAMWRALLRRTRRRIAAFRRRVSFSLANLSSSARVHGRIYFRHSRICRADCARGDGIWKIPEWRSRLGSPVLLSFAVVWVVALFHLKNLRVGSAFQNCFTVVKLLLVGAFIVAGFFVQPKQPIKFLPEPGDAVTIFGAPFAVALVYVMYSYSGWNAAAYINKRNQAAGKKCAAITFCRYRRCDHHLRAG